MRHITLVLLATLLLLDGCSSNPHQIDCQNINWKQVGNSDATHGMKCENLATIFPSCGSTIIIDKKAYELGWKQGIQVYCHPRNGVRLGLAGKYYNAHICPASMMSAFDKAWHDGIRIFCNPHNGYKVGLNGEKFPGFCPSKLSRAFHHAYRRGAKDYKELAKIQSKIDYAASELEAVQTVIQRDQKQLQSMNSSYSQQSFSPEIQANIQKLTTRVRRLKGREASLMSTKAKLSAEYQSLRNTFLRMD